MNNIPCVNCITFSICKQRYLRDIKTYIETGSTSCYNLITLESYCDIIKGFAATELMHHRYKAFLSSLHYLYTGDYYIL